MAYDEKLADRARKVLEDERDVTEKKMFGGLAFMLGGNMYCGIVGDDADAASWPRRLGACAQEEARAPDGFHRQAHEGHGLRWRGRPEDEEDVAGELKKFSVPMSEAKSATFRLKPGDVIFVPERVF